MKKKSNFLLRMDGKTLEKNRRIFMNASENENISAIFSWENFLNILCSVICQNKWVDKKNHVYSLDALILHL